MNRRSAATVLILNSDDLASRVIKKLNLESHREFQDTPQVPVFWTLQKSVFQSNDGRQKRKALALKLPEPVSLLIQAS